MSEARKNQESAKVANMKAKVAYAKARMDEIARIAASPNWAKLNPMDQEFYAAENAAWKTVARIVNIRIKIEIGKAERAKAMQLHAPQTPVQRPVQNGWHRR